jgi:hypothetical protein
MKNIGFSIIILGAILIIIGLVFLFQDKIPFLGKLPGDISIKGKNTSFYFPVVTCIVISIVLSIALNLISKFFKH